MAELQIETTVSEEVKGVAVVVLTGAITTDNLQLLHDVFHRMSAEGAEFVVVDMAGVESMSAASVGELMGCRLALQRNDGELVIAGAGEALKEHFSALGVNKVFHQFKDVRSAIRFFGWEYRGQNDSFDLTFPSDLKYVPAIRQFVRRVAKQKGYSDKDAFRIETIVDEVCNNAVEHGSRSADSTVGMILSIDNRKIDLKVTNTCEDDSVETLKHMADCVAKPNVSEEFARGRGLALVKMLSSDFSIEDSGSGTSVRVTKMREE